MQAAVPRARSHLAAKNILVTLGQVFGAGVFTSSAALIRLGLDFLYTSRALSRMAQRPYPSLSVVRRVPRMIGGFENLYWISQRGWSKINYYRAHGAPVKQSEETLWDSMCKADYLLKGKGSESEVKANTMLKMLGNASWMPALFDELSRP